MQVHAEGYRLQYVPSCRNTRAMADVTARPCPSSTADHRAAAWVFASASFTLPSCKGSVQPQGEMHQETAASSKRTKGLAQSETAACCPLLGVRSCCLLGPGCTSRVLDVSHASRCCFPRSVVLVSALRVRVIPHPCSVNPEFSLMQPWLHAGMQDYALNIGN